MSDDTNGVGSGDGPKKKSKGLLIVLILGVLLGGGAFYGVFSGLIPLPFGEEPAEAEAEAEADPYQGDVPEAFAETRARVDPATIAFVGLEDMVISLGPQAAARHLKVKLSIEVMREEQEAVATLTPRIVDVLNTYLRAVDEREFELPNAMMRMQAQMLRRVQLVTPEGAVRDVLIQEFVLN